jgi:Sulfotransferase domain
LLPSFLIIGTQRAGTAPLFNVLRQHPRVAGPTGIHENLSWSRELHFFDERFERGMNWYRSCFPLAASRIVARLRGGDLLAGEATSSYLFDPAVPGRVAATLPDVNLIVMLRNPVERAYWHYESNRRKGFEPLTFEEALAAEEERAAEEDGRGVAQTVSGGPGRRPYGYVDRGLYADQLERWFTLFPRERFLVLRAENLVSRPPETYAELLSFLDLPAWQPERFPPVNWMSSAPIDAGLRARLEGRFAEPNARLARLLGSEPWWTPEPVASEGPAERGAAASTPQV